MADSLYSARRQKAWSIDPSIAIICYVNHLPVQTAVRSMHKSFKQVYRTSTLRNINMPVEKPCPREVRYVPGNLSQKPPAPRNLVDYRPRIRKDGKFGKARVLIYSCLAKGESPLSSLPPPARHCLDVWHLSSSGAEKSFVTTSLESLENVIKWVDVLWTSQPRGLELHSNVLSTQALIKSPGLIHAFKIHNPLLHLSCSLFWIQWELIMC